MSRRWSRALVTGASSGIGRATATELASRGTDVVLVARTAPRLEELATELAERHGVDTEVMPADLADHDERARVEARLRDDDGPVDLLVNNAGFEVAGDFVDLDRDAVEGQVRVNCGAVLALAHAAASRMSERGRGGILNVSSVGGFQPIPHHAVYAATKAFVTSLSEALHEELRGSGVHVTALCPGLTRTDFQDRADYDTGHLPDVVWMDPVAVARAGLDGVADNRAIVVPGWHNRAVAALSRRAPTAVTRRVAGLAGRRGAR